MTLTEVASSYCIIACVLILAASLKQELIQEADTCTRCLTAVRWVKVICPLRTFYLLWLLLEHPPLHCRATSAANFQFCVVFWLQQHRRTSGAWQEHMARLQLRKNHPFDERIEVLWTVKLANSWCTKSSSRPLVLCTSIHPVMYSGMDFAANKNRKWLMTKICDCNVGVIRDASILTTCNMLGKKVCLVAWSAWLYAHTYF